MDVFYQITAESFSSLDRKNGAVHNHKVITLDSSEMLNTHFVIL